MKKVEMYKLENGEVFETKREAKLRQKEIDLKKELLIFCDKEMTYDMRIEDIAETIFKHRDLFYILFDSQPK